MSSRPKGSHFDEFRAAGIEDANSGERLEKRIVNTPPRLGVNFTEAVGKVVAFVNVINNPPDWQALEIRFTDGTLLHFEFTTTHTLIKPKYMEARRGDMELIRNYGVLSPGDEAKADSGFPCSAGESPGS